MDFTRWMACLNVSYQGLAATHGMLDTCHSWRFCQRRLLKPDENDIVNEHPEWQNIPPADDDVILLLKESICSVALAQPPILAMPSVILKKLAPADALVPMARNDLGDRTRKEFRKAATVLAKAPWYLFRAQQYLEKLCEQNEKQVSFPCHHFGILAYRRQAVCSNEFIESHGTVTIVHPRKVTIGKITFSEMARRLRAAKVPAQKKPKAAAAKKMRKVWWGTCW